MTYVRVKSLFEFCLNKYKININISAENVDEFEFMNFNDFQTSENHLGVMCQYFLNDNDRRWSWRIFFSRPNLENSLLAIPSNFSQLLN